MNCRFPGPCLLTRCSSATRRPWAEAQYRDYYRALQRRRLEKDVLEQGGLRERMTRARLAYRNKQK